MIRRKLIDQVFYYLQAMEKLVEEMIDMGLKNFAEFCFGECFVKLTSSTIAFTRAIISHVDSSLKVHLLKNIASVNYKKCCGIVPHVLIISSQEADPLTRVFFHKVKKLNLHYTRDITTKRLTSGGSHLRGLAPGQHRAEEISQSWRAAGHPVSDLTGPGIKP